MRVIEFLDTTLRDGEQTPGVNFSIKEKSDHCQAVGEMGDFCH